MGNSPFEDVSPIKNGDFPLLCLFTRGYIESRQIVVIPLAANNQVPVEKSTYTTQYLPPNQEVETACFFRSFDGIAVVSSKNNIHYKFGSNDLIYIYIKLFDQIKIIKHISKRHL